MPESLLCPLRASAYRLGCSMDAVRPRSLLGIRDEGTDVGEVVCQAGIGRAAEGLEELIVGGDDDRAGLFGEG